MTGYLLINKPSGPTSHDVIDKLRRITGERRIGHAGTLDPFATGLLVVGVGREATRNLGKFVGLDKKYRAIIKLGGTSSTYDRTGEIKNEKLKMKNLGAPSAQTIDKVVASFIGKQRQMPPIYSAKKIKGKKAYEMARAGQEVKLEPQNIEIYSIEYTPYSILHTPYSLTIDIHCSSGTYIRSLAHDIGQKLGCGAYVEELERTSVGNFELDEAIKLSDINQENWPSYLINFNVVMASGTFEIFHPGHQFYLKEARKLGQKLVVVVARDVTAEKVRGRKMRRDEAERLRYVSECEFVDQAILGDPEDPYQSIKKIQPDVIALGYDQLSFVGELPARIRELGLKTKIARIGAYKPEEWKSSLLLCIMYTVLCIMGGVFRA